MLEIRLAKTVEEREQVYRLRYKVYVEEMGYEQHYADHQGKKIEEPLDESSILLAAFHSEQIVGSVRVNLARNSDLRYYPKLYQMYGVRKVDPFHTSITTKLVVQQDFRKTRASLKLIQACYQQFLINQIKFDFIDCDFRMIHFFEKFGYRCNRSVCHPEYGEGMVMTLDVQNLEYLEKIKSPFRTICRDFFECHQNLSYPLVKALA